MTRLSVPRLIRSLSIGALVGAALLIPATAGASDCTVAKNANCAGQDMRHLGTGMMHADMSGSDMRGADMRGMNLTGVNLSNADLRGAKLNGAIMNGAKLNGTTMSGVRMTGVAMRGVTMRKTNMRNMRMKNVKIDHATLVGVDFTGARFTGGGITRSSVRSSQPDTNGRSGRRLQSRALSCRLTVFAGTNIGTPDEAPFSFAGSTLSGDYTCNGFFSVDWTGATIVDADFRYARFYDTQETSAQLLIADSTFASVDFTEKFIAPALAIRVNLDRATCEAAGGELWGRFDGEHAHAVSDTLWRIGLVASESDGTVVFQPSPAPVNLTAARLATLNARLQSGASPAIVTTNSSCIAGS